MFRWKCNPYNAVSVSILVLVVIICTYSTVHLNHPTAVPYYSLIRPVNHFNKIEHQRRLLWNYWSILSTTPSEERKTKYKLEFVRSEQRSHDS